LRRVLRPKMPAVKTAASWKKFLRELLMESSEKIARVIQMFVARGPAMIGLAQLLIGKEKSLWKEDQRRRGGFDKNEAESAGEELRLEPRNAIVIEVSEIDGAFRIAESQCESVPAESRRDCGAGRVVSKESAGRQVGAIAAACAEELREWFDGW